MQYGQMNNYATRYRDLTSLSVF